MTATEIRSLTGKDFRMRYALLLTLLAGCAASPSRPQPAPEPVKAATTPVATPEPEPKIMSPGDYLKLAFGYHTAKAYERSIENFENAIATGRLNNVGRAISYWHIGEAHERMERYELAAEAFFSFTVVAQEILESGEHQDGFVKEFDLSRRIDVAVNYIDAIWDVQKKFAGEVQ
jgi:tetratricopeptide (TPR) repeat protein